MAKRRSSARAFDRWLNETPPTFRQPGLRREADDKPRECEFGKARAPWLPAHHEPRRAVLVVFRQGQTRGRCSECVGK